MDRNTLEIFLPAFMIAFVVIALLHVRNQPVRIFGIPITIGIAFSTRTPANKVVWSILGISALLVFLYSFFPQVYLYALPIERLDHPVINTLGILILKLSIIWLIIAQVNIDRLRFLIKEGISIFKASHMVLYAQRLYLAGILIMSLGLFVTISSVGSFILVLIGILLLKRS